MLGGIGLDGQTHVACVLLGLCSQVARVLRELVLQALGLGSSLSLELGRLVQRVVADLLGSLLGRFEDPGDALADSRVAAGLRGRLGRGLLAASALVHQCRSFPLESGKVSGSETAGQVS